MAGLPKGKRLSVVLYDRSSYETQRQNLELRRPIIIDELAPKYGVRLRIKRYAGEVADGRSSRLRRRIELRKAIEYCRKYRCVLLVPCVDRLVRPARYARENQFSLLCEADLERLKKLTHEVVVASIIPPGTPPKKARGLLGAWRLNKGGRPKAKPSGYKKMRRKKYRPIARKLRKKGRSYNAIRIALAGRGADIPKSTVVRWTNDIIVTITVIRRVG